MKKTGLIIALTGFVCLSSGFIVGKFSESVKFAQDRSLASGTLQGLARAVENERRRTGKYPENLELLDGSSFVTGDYSREVATRVVYIPTEKGYFMAVGSPFQAFTDQTGHIQTKMRQP